MQFVADHNRTVFVKSNLVQVIVIHAVTLAVAPFYFTPLAMGFALFTMFLFGYSMGIFHHMLLTHRSFKCKKWIENTGAFLGTLTWRGPFAGPTQYVAMHRVHHAFADTELDPHTPTKGIFFALMSWFWNMPLGFTKAEYYNQYATDMASDPFHTFLDRNVHWIQLGWAVCCFAGGMFIPVMFGGAADTVNGLRYVIYGVFVRAFFSLYLINAVDVINHTVGYRGYETKDNSTNSILMSVIHLGGAISWHNNHHAHQHYFNVKKKWWEFDAHHVFLQGLEKLGLVWEIQILDESPKGLREKERKAAAK